MQPGGENPTSNGAALGMVLTTVVIASLIAPGMHLTAAAASPFTTNLALRGGMGLGNGLLLLAIFGNTIRRHRPALLQTSKRRLALGLAAAALPTLDYTMFSLAIRHIDVATAAVVIDAWPLFLLPMSALAYRGTLRFEAMTPLTAAAAAACAAGILMLAAAEAGSVPVVFDTRGPAWPALPAGLALALAGALSVATAPFMTRQCEAMAQELRQRTGTPQGVLAGNAALMYLLFLLSVANIVSAALVCAPAALASSEAQQLRHTAAWLLYGTLAQSLSAAAWRTALMLTTKRHILNLIYFLPTLALLWLHLLDAVQVRSIAHLLAGTAMIVAANAAANMRPPRNRNAARRP